MIPVKSAGYHQKGQKCSAGRDGINHKTLTLCPPIQQQQLVRALCMTTEPYFFLLNP